MSNDEADFAPSWLDSENDQTHRDEVQPLLFGKGKLDLTDPSETDDADNPIDESENQSKASKIEERSSSKAYGSINTSSSPKNSLWTIQTPVSSRDSEDAASNNNDIWGEGKEKPESSEDEENPFLESKDSFHERPGRPSKPSRHCIVSMFYTIESYAMITNLGMLVSQALPLVAVSWEDSDPGYLTLKIYLCIFAIIFLFVEIDHPAIPFLRKASFLKTYASRGFLYTFFGLVCFEEAGSEKANFALAERAQGDSSVFRVSWFALVNQVAAISLLAVGVLYFLMGIVCLQKVRNRYVYDDRQKWKAHREALDKWDQGL